MKNKAPKKHRRRLSKTIIREAIDESGGNITLIAERCGVTRRAIYKWLKKHPELKDTIEEDGEKLGEMAHRRLLEAAKEGVPWAVTRVLNRYGKHLGFGKVGAGGGGLRKVVIEYVNDPQGDKYHEDGKANLQSEYE